MRSSGQTQSPPITRSKQAPNGNIKGIMLIPFFSPRSSSLICALLFAGSALGQTLTIKKVNSNYLLQASASASTPLTLQASDNMHLWVDIQEDIGEQFSIPVDIGDSVRFYRLTPVVEPAPPIKVVMIGDSMTADCCGWGQGMYQYFKPNATFVNYSEPWTSTKLFMQSAEMDKMQLLKPDYVLMQFAYSECCNNPDSSTTLDEFENNMRTLVQVVRGFNGVPILITLHAGRFWDSQGKLIPSRNPYDARTMKVAADLNTPLVDLYPITSNLLTQLGESGSAFMKWMDPDDGLHSSPLGATYISHLFTHYLPDYFGPYLTGIFNPPPKP